MSSNNDEIELEGKLLILLIKKHDKFLNTRPVSTCVQELTDDVLREVREQCGNDFRIDKEDLKQGKSLLSVSRSVFLSIQ